MNCRSHLPPTSAVPVWFAFLCACLVLAAPSPAATADHPEGPSGPPDVRLVPGFKYAIVLDGDAPEPMDLQFAADGHLWVIGREGYIWRVSTGTKQKEQIAKLEVDHSGDRGLLSFDLHPDFLKNGEMFVFYSPPQLATNSPRSRVSRFTVSGNGSGNELVAGSEKILLEFPLEPRGQHTGGGVTFNPKDGKIYVTVGDNNAIVNLPKYYNDPDNQAQNLNDLRGKTLRLNPDGSIPTDNPFYNQSGKRGEIFTRGHRQPWRIRVDPATGNLYEAENGGDREQDFEEINLLQAGANYGWPRVYGDNHDMFDATNIVAGFTKPWLTYPRYNGGSCTCALFYRAETGKFLFPPEYRDVLFYSDYNRRSVRVARVDPKTNTAIKTEQFGFNFSGGPVSARIGPDGALYLAEYGGWFRATRNDRISRIIWEGK